MVQQGLEAGAEYTGKYEILRVVNRGGMGEIALARVKGSKGFEKLVVLKRLRADAERDDHREMFDVEAELMSRIEHPNVVQVYDQPRIGGVQYLAMAYVRGRNLDQIVRRTRQATTRISPAFTLTIMGEVLRGLAFVHRLKDDQGRALGVVHQDITPSNILVSFFGEVKITDFGIAYVTSRDGGRRAGVLKGKPRYVSPEVLAGRRVNNRADVYGVGVVLYEMLAGRALFSRPSLEETLAAVARNELPDFKMVFPHLSDGVHRLLSRALAKDPQDRYRTAEEMHADLAQELATLGGPIPAGRIGYLARQWFSGDPDVPEVDPTFDATLAEDSARPQVTAKAPNLDQTITELDRLLGGESSADLFQLPPEIQRELASLEDMEPFAALTPIPDLALSGPNGEELLLRDSLEQIDMLPPGPLMPNRGSDDAGLSFEPIPGFGRSTQEAPRPSPPPSRPSKPDVNLPPFPGAPASVPPRAKAAAPNAAPQPSGHRPVSSPNTSAATGSNPPPAGQEEGEDSALVRSVTNRARRSAMRASPGEYTYAPGRPPPGEDAGFDRVKTPHGGFDRVKTPHDMIAPGAVQPPFESPRKSTSSSGMGSPFSSGSYQAPPPKPTTAPFGSTQHPPFPASANHAGAFPGSGNFPAIPNAGRESLTPPHGGRASLTPPHGGFASSGMGMTPPPLSSAFPPPNPFGPGTAPPSNQFGSPSGFGPPSGSFPVPQGFGPPSGTHPAAPRFPAAPVVGTAPVASEAASRSAEMEAEEEGPNLFWVGMVVGLLVGAAVVCIVFWAKLFG